MTHVTASRPTPLPLSYNLCPKGPLYGAPTTQVSLFRSDVCARTLVNRGPSNSRPYLL